MDSAADAKPSAVAHAAPRANKMSRPPVGELSISTESKKDISPMAAILRSRGHLQHSSAIPGSPTDKLMSPTSRKLRKKGHVDDKYGLQETKERLSFEEESSRAATADTNVVLGSASITKRHVLEQRGWVFTVLEYNCDLEVAVGKSTDSPLHVAKTIAHALLPHFEDAEKPVILLTAAQVYKIGDSESVRHPPADEAEAVGLLQDLSDQTVHFQTAVVATICPGGHQVNEISDAIVSFKTISKDMATRLVKRNYTVNSKNCPIQDVELKLRCRIESGTEDSVLGIPVDACENVLKAVLETAPQHVQDLLTGDALAAGAPPPPEAKF